MTIIKFNRPFILATASEARRKLVSDLGFSVIFDSVDIDERTVPDETINDYVRRLAKEKADACVPSSLDAVIVAVDTAIGLGKTIIGKPRDEKHAKEILELLSGRTHEVVSAIAVRDVKEATIEIESTRTEIRCDDLSDVAINWYLATGEWKGRAGAYAIQGKGAALVKEVQGCFTNVIGLSIPTLLRMLRKISI